MTPHSHPIKVMWFVRQLWGSSRATLFKRQFSPLVSHYLRCIIFGIELEPFPGIAIGDQPRVLTTDKLPFLLF